MAAVPCLPPARVSVEAELPGRGIGTDAGPRRLPGEGAGPSAAGGTGPLPASARRGSPARHSPIGPLDGGVGSHPERPGEHGEPAPRPPPPRSLPSGRGSRHGAVPLYKSVRLETASLNPPGPARSPRPRALRVLSSRRLFPNALFCEGAGEDPLGVGGGEGR